jgi:hypothetical protein
MGCRVVMLVSHKKKADKSLAVTLSVSVLPISIARLIVTFRHESKPQSSKKSFSVSSDGIKEWSTTGFEYFAEWSKAELCTSYILLVEFRIDS